MLRHTAEALAGQLAVETAKGEAAAQARPLRLGYGQRVKNLDTPRTGADTTNMATVAMTEEAFAQFDRLPKVIRARVRRLTQRLEAWPTVSGAKPLSGDLAGFYRLRTGDYRLRFRIEGETVIVDKIGHRSEFYED